jgi:glycosyltransferase involved in cell wall biosynthesis
MMKKIRILHIIGTFLNGGTERLMLDILSRLDKKIFDVTACSYGNQYLSSVVEAFQQAGIKIINFHFPAGIRLLWILNRYIRTNRFHIVHTHHYTANMYCRPAAILAQTPLIMTYQHNWPMREKERHRRVFHLLNKWTYKNITVSDALRDYDIEKVGVSPDKVVTIHNGINTELFRPGTKVEIFEFRQSLGISPKSIIIGVVGRLVITKSIDVIIKAMPAILQVHPNTYLIIAGEGDMRDSLEKLALKLGIREQVKFLGWVGNTAKIFHGLDIFCFSSGAPPSNFSDGFGLVTVEAMASGIPVVAIDNKVNREIITERCGLFCKPTPNDLAMKINLLIDDPELRSNLGQNGRRRTAEVFNIERTVQQLSNIYLQAMRLCEEK